MEGNKMTEKIRIMYSKTYRFSFRLVACVLVISVLLITACSQKPTEKELRAQFFEHKTEINMLLKMQHEDSKVIRIAPTFTRLSNDWSWPRKEIGFSEKRWDEYRHLFILAKINNCLQKEKESVAFLVDRWRGFIYFKKPPHDIRKSFEECHMVKKSDTCFVPVDGNWYLFKG
jgi:hypothetical protein